MAAAEPKMVALTVRAYKLEKNQGVESDYELDLDTVEIEDGTLWIYVTEPADHPPTPEWVEGWTLAMNWLEQAYGEQGKVLADEMRTRLPGGPDAG